MKYQLSIIGLVLSLCATAFAEEVVLCENPWTGSVVNNAIAKILLEQELDVDVELIAIDQYSMWPAIAGGEISACLEIWPSGHSEELAQYIDSGLVERIGDLGVIGKVGWFMPAYMLEQDPDLATWEGFLSEEAAAVFATAQTGDKGQFVAGDPSWGQYDAAIIDNLGMNFEVVYSGSEAAVLASLDAAYSREDPFLFYFWTPHSAFQKYELVNVSLPPYSDECWAGADDGDVACDYPEDVLFKIASPSLAEDAPSAYAFLSKMSYSNADQIGLIAAIDDEGLDAEEAAQAWIDANEDVWSAWLSDDN